MDVLSQNVNNLTSLTSKQAASLEETVAAMQISLNNIVKMTSFANEVSSSILLGQGLASKIALSMDNINEQPNLLQIQLQLLIKLHSKQISFH